MTVTATLVRVFTGALLDRFGRVGMLIGGTALMVCTIASYAIFPVVGIILGLRLIHGLAVLFSYPGVERYEHVKLPHADAWGVYFPEGDPLAAKDSISPEDLEGLPLIASEQALETDELSAWFGGSLARAKVAATYTLGYNGLVFVREGAGYMLGLDALAPTGPGTGLEFRPLWPPIAARIDFAWRRGQQLSNAASQFLEDLIAAL